MSVPLGEFQRWRANCVPTRSDGKNTEIYGYWLIGDAYSNQIGYLSDSTYTEFTEPIRTEIVTGVLFDERRRHTIAGIDLDMETGLGGTADITLETSGDGQRNWSSRRWRSMGSAATQKRVRWNKLGANRQTVFRFIVDDPVKRVFIALHGRLLGRSH